jgi:hypothetical protein
MISQSKSENARQTENRGAGRENLRSKFACAAVSRYSPGMSITGYFRAYWRRAAGERLERRLAQEQPHLGLARSEWGQSLKNPNEFYVDCVRYFHQKLPAEVREHRAYFHNVPGKRRGFGENAFHTMWYLLLQEFRPRNFLEIGVFRGQVISLAAVWARLQALPCDIWGISPFSGAGDASSKYRQDLDYYLDTLQNFEHLRLPRPNLVRASSIDPEALRAIESRTWDMIYIDGNHDYEVVRKDWENCARHTRRGGIIVLDDSGLTTSYQPPVFASAGITGPSQLAKEIDRAQFPEILQVGHNRGFQKA